MRKKIPFLFLFLIPYFLNATSDKIKIQISEEQEEVPFYRTFLISAENPFDENKTILGTIFFENGEQCPFYLEVKASNDTKIIRHCNVKKRKLKYEVKVEYVYPFIIKE